MYSDTRPPIPDVCRMARAVSCELGARRAFSARRGILQEEPPPLCRVVAGIGPLCVEKCEVAGLEGCLAPVLDQSGAAAELQAE